ncbi:MAG: TetR/AcrR family transcriptional regulator [Acidimicrobiales bacterium]
MSHSSVATVHKGRPAVPSAAQARVITAALDLFARHGVGGTSLQMIAHEIGVTKAAVYHQYKTKDEIVLAAAESELGRLEVVLDAAETESSPKRARDALIAGIVDLAIDRGRIASSILSDPVIVGFFADHDAFRDVMLRLRHILVGDDAGPEARVRTAMLIAAISGAVMHPFVADLSDDVLRAELLRLARRFLALPA